MKPSFAPCILAVLSAAIMTAPTDAGVTVAAPEITASTWLNSPPQAIAALHGKVALVEFWTFGCYNCRNVEPHVKEWNRKYADRGLVVIGVHTPETAYERDIENVSPLRP